MASEADKSIGRRGASALSGTAVRLAFAISGLFLVAGLGLFILAAARFVWPELLDGNGMLSYGRVFPAGANALLFGWLTVAFLGLAFHAVPRLVGASLAFPLIALGVILLVAGGAAGGVAMVLFGENAGGRWLEFPLLFDAALAAGYVGAAGLLVLTARRGQHERIPLPAWYLIAGSVWLLLAHVAGAVPGLDGLPAEIQSTFTGTALFGLWAASAGVGVAYFVAGRVLPDATFNERLGRIGFWSLTLTWAWTAGRLVQYGPTQDWIETVPVVFGAGLVVAVLAIAADFAGALQGRWSAVKDSPPLQMAVAGLGFLAVTVTAAFVASLRSVSSVVQFTPWESGVETAALLGAFTLFAFAGIAHVAPAARGRSWGRWSGRLVVWPVTSGVGVAVATRLIGGLQEGLSWLAGVQSGAYDNTSDGFEFSFAPLRGLDMAYLVGLTLVLAGAAVFVLRLLSLSLGSATEIENSTFGYTTQPLKTLLRGAVAVFVFAGLGTFAFPAIDSHAEASVLAESTRNFAANPAAQLGREVYIREGCWYCHTQQVRQVITDIGLGPVSQPGDYVYDPVGLAGSRRIGPDLTHQGSRADTGSAAWVRTHLSDPRADEEWSVMPSFRYLSDEELTALSVYVSGLE
ncbi:MAG: cbb3-type cytochrome c oxidase subunit II [Actinomycetota bacterium]